MPRNPLQAIQSVCGPVDEQRAFAPRASAVLSPLFVHGGEPWLLLTARAAILQAHPRQISFPGGRIEPDDDGPLAAALRETLEETGIAPHEVKVLGHLLDYTTFRDDPVACYVGAIDATALPTQEPESPEVDAFLTVRVADLLRPGARPAPDRPPHAVRVVSYESRSFPTGPPVEHLLHYWHLSDGRTLWGITGDLVAHLLAAAYGWSPPSTPRPLADRSGVYP